MVISETGSVPRVEVNITHQIDERYRIHGPFRQSKRKQVMEKENNSTVRNMLGRIYKLDGSSASGMYVRYTTGDDCEVMLVIVLSLSATFV